MVIYRYFRLLKFVNYIKETKVVLLEDLAAQFHLKTQEAIDRVTQLQEDGLLTGVIDDRGKFIYISQVTNHRPIFRSDGLYQLMRTQQFLTIDQ